MNLVALLLDRQCARKARRRNECAEVLRHMNSGALLFSRSLIVTARKT